MNGANTATILNLPFQNGDVFGLFFFFLSEILLHLSSLPCESLNQKLNFFLMLFFYFPHLLLKLPLHLDDFDLLASLSGVLVLGNGHILL